MNKVIIGGLYGELSVIKSLGKSTGSTKYECACSCGKAVPVRGYNLTSGKTKSCGCKTSEYKRTASTKHGLHSKRSYSVWKNMMARCYNDTHVHYAYYGGKGVKVCDDWLTVEGFYAYWGEIDKPMTLDRLNSQGGYSPENTKLSTPKEQANNRSSNVYIGDKTLSELSDAIGIPYATVAKRKLAGWTDEEIKEKRHMKNKSVSYGEELLNIRQLSEATGIKYTTLMSRYNVGDRGERLWRT